VAQEEGRKFGTLHLATVLSRMATAVYPVLLYSLKQVLWMRLWNLHLRFDACLCQAHESYYLACTCDCKFL
jgi:hypothetical protein